MKIALVAGSSRVHDQPLRDAMAGLPAGSSLVLISYVAPPEPLGTADEVVMLTSVPWPAPRVPVTSSSDEGDAEGEPAPSVERRFARRDDETMKAYLGRVRRRVRRRLSPLRQALEVHRRVVWRAVRRNPRAMAVLMDADVLVAHDNTAVYAVWQVSRRRPSVPAVLTLPAAVNLLSAQTADPTGRPAPGA